MNSPPLFSGFSHRRQKGPTDRSVPMRCARDAMRCDAMRYAMRCRHRLEMSAPAAAAKPASATTAGAAESDGMRELRAQLRDVQQIARETIEVSDATGSMQQTRCSMQHATCNTQHAADNMQPTADNRRPASDTPEVAAAVRRATHRQWPRAASATHRWCGTCNGGRTADSARPRHADVWLATRGGRSGARGAQGPSCGARHSPRQPGLRSAGLWRNCCAQSTIHSR